MLFSLAVIILIGFALSDIFKRLRLPGFIGMIATGILLGPNVTNLISNDILNISHELREIALVVILTRAGLSLDLNELKKVGRPAILMCFVPAIMELAGIIILAPVLLHISYMEAAILGTVLAAVSPAVVVPKMIRLSEEGYGREKSIPQLIMAGASVDDVLVIVLFTSFLGMYKGDGLNMASLLMAPISIIIGMIIGWFSGVLLNALFERLKMRDTVKILLILSVAFLLVVLGDRAEGTIRVSGLIGVMFMGISLLRKNSIRAKKLGRKFSKIWVLAEVILFVLVGASVDVSYVSQTGVAVLILIVGELFFRISGVMICMIGTKLNKKERVFCAIAYIPKATVQAAIGAVPLAEGVESGNAILAVAVLVILITAPLGAVGIDLAYKKLLKKEREILVS